MSLDQYESMRDLSATPEPAGGRPSSGSPLRFVVQKHAASRLHYDFRLEIGDVLVSWAVPKGPSLNPETKHLAIKVEDHPYDYRNFEGTIPEGQYGAGTVMIWDQGTYEPLHYTGDSGDDQTAHQTALRAALHKGHLTFILHGTKLKGEWALIKIHDSEENAWLLVKAGKDEWSSDTKDITEEELSAASGRTMEEIATGAPAVPFPKDFSPMLATLSDKPFDDPDWIYEVKWDGYRALATINHDDVRLHSRNGQDFRDKYRPITEALQAMTPASVILDGEIVVVDDSGHSKFELLQQYADGGGRLQFYVFDVLYLNGRNLTDTPLIRRKELLKSWLPPSDVIRFSDHIVGEGKTFFELAATQGLEGVIAKNAHSRYLPGKRSPSWLKIKHHLRQEAVIGGFTAPQGSRTGFGSLILGVYQDGELNYVGHSGGGFDERSLTQLHTRLLKLAIEESPFENKFKANSAPTWVRPELVCEVQFTEWTSDSRMRHPVFLGLREDKPAGEIAREVPEPANAPDPELKFQITHPAKIYWPDDGFTKGQLIDYYTAAAPFILPYLTNRPQSLLRFPHGITGQSFFQKDMPDHPEFITTETVHSDSENRDIHYPVIKDLNDLLYLVNLGCVDFNPWNSRVGSLDQPDWCVIDLDPEDIGFEAVIQTARAVHEVLHSAGIPSYPKTSGATGMHIFIPLGAKYTHDQSRDFAHIIVQIVHAKLPNITSLERSPKKRQGKIYLDYLQNRRGQTLAAPYCVRPRPDRPVSTPLQWDEVKPGLKPIQFTVANIFDRLESLGDIWKPVIGDGIDLLKTLGKLT